MTEKGRLLTTAELVSTALNNIGVAPASAQTYAILALVTEVLDLNITIQELSIDLRTILEVLVREVAPPEEPEPPRDYESLDMLSGEPTTDKGG